MDIHNQRYIIVVTFTLSIITLTLFMCKYPTIGLADSPDTLYMKHRLKTIAGKAVYNKRKCTVEPVFGIIKAAMGFRQFLLRGHDRVAGEWDLVCTAYNIKRLHALSPL